MTPALVRLAELLGPPRPGVVSVPWDEAIATVGFQFPADYRELIDTYGRISINGDDGFHIAGPSGGPSIVPGVPTGLEWLVLITGEKPVLPAPRCGPRCR